MAQKHTTRRVVLVFMSLVLTTVSIGGGVAAANDVGDDGKGKPSSARDTCQALCVIECIMRRPTCLAECMERCRERHNPPPTPTQPKPNPPPPPPPQPKPSPPPSPPPKPIPTPAPVAPPPTSPKPKPTPAPVSPPATTPKPSDPPAPSPKHPEFSLRPADESDIGRLAKCTFSCAHSSCAKFLSGTYLHTYIPCMH